jgi:thiol-disulfide isomerase/thioredoxin
MKLTSIIITAVIIAGCYGKKPEIREIGLKGQPMPAIELLAVDSLTHFNTRSIELGKPTILFSFEPWCPYCRAQTRSIISQIKKLKDINIYMMCTSKYSEFKKFYNKYQFQKYPNIHIGIDYKKSFNGYFQEGSVPCLAIYGANKTLKQVMVGKNYISTLKDAALN